MSCSVFLSVVPPSIAAPNVKDQVVEALGRFEGATSCDQKLAPVIDAFLQGNVLLLNRFVLAHVDMNNVCVVHK